MKHVETHQLQSTSIKSAAESPGLKAHFSHLINLLNLTLRLRYWIGSCLVGTMSLPSAWVATLETEFDSGLRGRHQQTVMKPWHEMLMRRIMSFIFGNLMDTALQNLIEIKSF